MGAVGAGGELDADMGMNYRGFGLAWLVLWLALPAGAEMLTLGELSLNMANTWQRGSVEEEADFDSIVLRERSAPLPLEMYLAKNRVRLKMAEAKFIDQLEQSWRRRYGAEAELDWLDAAGTRWRICRRPSRSGEGYVFQIVTVHGGEVYQLVATAPATIKALPESVRTFLASAAWTGVKLPERRETTGAQSDTGLPADSPALSYGRQVVAAGAASKADATMPAPATVMPKAATAKPEPAPTIPAPATAEPGKATTKPAAITPTPATMAPAPVAVVSEPVITVKPQRQWRLLRTVIALPGSKAWPGLAEAEGAQLGSNGLVKGLGLSAEASGLDGFLEGFLWQKGEGAGEHRQPYRRHWQVLWPSFPAHWQVGEELAFDLDFLADTVGLGPGGDMTLQFELTPVCASRTNVVRWLDGLEARGSMNLSQLAGMICADAGGAPAPTKVTVAAGEYPAGATAKVRKRVALPLAAEWEQGIRPKSRAEVARLVLTIRFQISEGGNAPGDAMFRQAAVVFVFGPEV
ncbi:MAG: hypothetical protein WC474_00520 [Hydrogenophilaceae bacterium]